MLYDVATIYSHNFNVEIMSCACWVSICRINARSLMSIDTETQSYRINELEFDVICVSESWLDNSILDTDIHIPNYAVFRKDRNRHGGGVLIYVSDSLSAVRRLNCAPPPGSSMSGIILFSGPH